MDFNHPFAGMTVRYEGVVEDVGARQHPKSLIPPQDAAVAEEDVEAAEATATHPAAAVAVAAAADPLGNT